MAKVEMSVGGTDFINAADIMEGCSKYADGVYEETTILVLVDDLIGDRKVVQRKIDAARKRLKRLTNRLNNMEKQWSTAA